MADESRIAHLIVKQLCGTISEEENFELDRWVNESPDHRRFMKKRMRPKLMTKRATKLLDIDRAAIRERFEQLRTGINPTPHPPTIKTKIWNIIRYSALRLGIIALPIASDFIEKILSPSNFAYNQRTDLLDSLSKMISKNPTEMTLTLSTGPKTEGEIGKMPQQELEYKIVKEEDGSLAYVRFSSRSATTQARYTYNTLTTSKNADPALLLLPDGTLTNINPGTSLRYPVVPNEKDAPRLLALHGEATFDIARNSNSPFIVETKRVEVIALGTEFRIRDYGTEDSARVTALSGRVEVRDGKSKVILTANQGVIIGASFSRLKFFSEMVSMPEVVRGSGMFHFTNRTTGSIMHEISRWYSMDEPKFIDVDTARPGQLGCGILPKSLPLDSLLNIIATDHIHFDIDIERRSIIVHR